MKNLSRLLLVLFATQLLVAGIARASITSSTAADQKSHLSVMPGGSYEDEGNEPF